MRRAKLMQNIRNLGDFIDYQMKKLGIESAREFATLVHVSHNTISRQLDPLIEKRPDPTPDFLKKLAAATQFNLRDLIEIAYPGFVYTDGSFDADTALINQLLKDASDDTKRAVIAVLDSATAGRKAP